MEATKIIVLRDQLAARDSLIAAMRYNIDEKQDFIDYLLAEFYRLKREGGDYQERGHNESGDKVNN